MLYLRIMKNKIKFSEMIWPEHETKRRLLQSYDKQFWHEIWYLWFLSRLLERRLLWKATNEGHKGDCETIKTSQIRYHFDTEQRGWVNDRSWVEQYPTEINSLIQNVDSLKTESSVIAKNFQNYLMAQIEPEWGSINFMIIVHS